jgi:hypothetical protein
VALGESEELRVGLAEEAPEGEVEAVALTLGEGECERVAVEDSVSVWVTVLQVETEGVTVAERLTERLAVAQPEDTSEAVGEEVPPKATPTSWPEGDGELLALTVPVAQGVAVWETLAEAVEEALSVGVGLREGQELAVALGEAAPRGLPVAATVTVGASSVEVTLALVQAEEETVAEAVPQAVASAEEVAASTGVEVTLVEGEKVTLRLPEGQWLGVWLPQEEAVVEPVGV